MNQQLHPTFAEIWRMHGVHTPMTAEVQPTPEAIDAAMLADKLADGYGKRNEAQALRLQMADQTRRFE